MMGNEIYPQTDNLSCKKCGGTTFSFKWVTKSHDDMLRKALCHDGWGYMLEDSIVKCVSCGMETPYQDEIFLELRSE